MKNIQHSLYALILVSVFSEGVQAQGKINVVTTAAPFLRISPDARAGGMGETGIATAADANAVYWNLAKTSFADKNAGIAITYTPWLQNLHLNDVYLADVGGYYRLDDRQAIAASFRYFSLGNIQFTDFNGNDLQSFRPKELCLDAGYTRKLSEKAGLGIALRYIYSNLAGGTSQQGTSYKAGNALAGDLSFYYNGRDNTGSGWSFGATLTNLGTKIGYSNDAAAKDFIPADLGLGAAYSWQPDENNQLLASLDVHKLMVPTPASDSAGLVRYHSKPVVSSWFSSFSDAPGGFSEELKEVQVCMGLEYIYNHQFSLRSGYFYEDKTKGNRQYFTVGAGIKYNLAALNISYIIPSGSGVNQNPLSNTLRFSLLFDIER